MNRNQTLLCTLVLGPVFLTGCALGPGPTRPNVITPASWKESESPAMRTATALPAAWWRIFDDAELASIETEVIAANQDLQQALARLNEARALTRLSAAELYPNLSVGSSHTRQRLSKNNGGAPGQPLEFEDHRGSFDLNYEVDFWRRARRANAAARADALALEHDMQTVLLALTADAARHYFQLRSVDDEKRVIEATLELRRDAVRLQQTRSQAGLINEMDVTRARTEVANVEAELHALVRRRSQLEHALAVLCGRPPATFVVSVQASLSRPPSIPAGLPSTLLQRRPDIAAADEKVQAAAARIAVAKADFFPRLTLTGSAGLASADLGSLLESDSRGWQVGPSVHLPLFDGGRNRAALKAAEARYEGASAAYRGTVLNAFREVEDSLSDLATLAAQNEAIDRALLSARDTAELALQRYQKGLSSYLDVVDAQRGALQAERLAVQLNGQRIISTLLLAKALGGGWEPSSATRFASVGEH